MSTTADEYRARTRGIIHELSEEIADRTSLVATERTHPRFDADESDDAIRGGREQVYALREIREKLETLFFGAIE